MRLKIIAAIVLGILLSIVLVYLITDMLSPYMNLYNFATFLMIFAIATIALTLIFIALQKFKRKTIDREFIGKRTFLSLISMNIFLVVFGISFYDYSTPKSVPFGVTYNHEYLSPSQLDDGWEVSSLAKQGMDTLMYNEVIDKLVNDKAFKRMHSLLIIKNGKLVAEDYFYGYDINTPHDLRSANKTITSILMGIAIDQGFIKNVDEKVYDLFPEYQNVINWGGK